MITITNNNINWCIITNIIEFYEMLENNDLTLYNINVKSCCNLKHFIDPNKFNDLLSTNIIIPKRKIKWLLGQILNISTRALFSKSHSLYFYINGESYEKCGYTGQNQKFNIQYWVKRKYKLDRAIELSKLYYNNFYYAHKRLTTSWDINFWIDRGYTKSEAIIEVSKIQTKNNKRLQLNKLKYPKKYENSYTTNLKYYISRGYSEDDAVKQLKNRQSTFSLTTCIKKYGKIEGKRKWEERQLKWQNTLNDKSDLEKCKINKRKGKTKNQLISKFGVDKTNEILKSRLNGGAGFCRASKESLRLILPLYKFFRKQGVRQSDIYLGVGRNVEYSLKSENRICFYDFSIPCLNLIIEYHGIKFHPKMNDTKWTNPFGITYDIQYKLDQEKQKLAKDNMFDYYEFFSTDNLNDCINEIKGKYIETLNN